MHGRRLKVITSLVILAAVAAAAYVEGYSEALESHGIEPG